MSVQFFPALEGYDKNHFLTYLSCDWTSIPRKIDELNVLTDQLGLVSLISFLNVTRDESIFDDETMDELEKDGELIDGIWYYQDDPQWSIEPQWFSPEQGLRTICSLLPHLRSDYGLEVEMTTFNEQDWEHDYLEVMIELAALEEILNRAVQEHKMFRICIR